MDYKITNKKKYSTNFLMYILLICNMSICISCSADELLHHDVHYEFTLEPIDVVIPCTRKDLDTLELCIQGIKKNGRNIRRVIVVSPEKLTDKAEWFSENRYPFSKYAIALHIFQDEVKAQNYLDSKNNRIGWILQQLMKLYASFVIPNLSNNVLILDADTIFLNPVSFLDEQGNPLFNVGTEHHISYFEHMERLLNGFEKCFQEHSGITHHMIFQKVVLQDLFDHISNYHQTEVWKALLQCVDLNELDGSCMSEYEIYFNFIFTRTDQGQIRTLKWTNSPHLSEVNNFKYQGYHYASFHTYMRE